MKRTLALLAIVLLISTSVFAARELKKSTAISVSVGPFYASSDHLTLATSIDAAEWSCKLIKGITGSNITVTASGGDNDAALITNGGGRASFELTAANTDTFGDLILEITDPNNDHITEYFTVVDPNYWDLKWSTGELDAYSVGGSRTAATNLTTAFATYWSHVWDTTSQFFITGLDPNYAANSLIVASGGSNTIATDPNGYVKVSTGTGTGQINLTSGVVDVNTTDVASVLPTSFSTVTIAGGKIAATAEIDPNADLGTGATTNSLAWYLQHAKRRGER